MKKGLTELVFILDRSGSMSGLESDTIGGFNAVIREQKKEEGECLVSTVLFDNETEKGSCIIMVGAGTASAEIDGIRDHFVREYGIMPEVLRRSDTEDSKVIVFKAVNSLIIPSYPSAKASRT